MQYPKFHIQTISIFLLQMVILYQINRIPILQQKDRDRLNVESSDIVWIVNKRKKSKR